MAFCLVREPLGEQWTLAVIATPASSRTASGNKIRLARIRSLRASPPSPQGSQYQRRPSGWMRSEGSVSACNGQRTTSSFPRRMGSPHPSRYATSAADTVRAASSAVSKGVAIPNERRRRAERLGSTASRGRMVMFVAVRYLPMPRRWTPPSRPTALCRPTAHAPWHSVGRPRRAPAATQDRR